MSQPWPPSAGLSTPTVPRKDAVFQTSASLKIHAPAALVFETVLNVSEYSKWNQFVPNVQIVNQPTTPEGSVDDFSHIRVNSIMTFMVVMDSSKPNKFTETGLQVTDISTPEKQSEYIPKELRESEGVSTVDLDKVYRVSWKQHGGFASKGLKTERTHEIIVLGENECELRTWEVYGGMLAYTVKWLYQKTLNEKFQLWGDDLKKFCEGKVAESNGAANS